MTTALIDLNDCSAQWLAEQDDEALEHAIRAFSTWTPEAVATLDNAFVIRTAAILPRSDALADLESLDDLLADAAQALPEDLAGSERYRHRWGALSEAIRYRYYAIQQNPVKNLQGYKWVEEILAYLGERSGTAVPLAELLESVKDKTGNPIKPANLSRVLNVMEDNLLITRERSGKNKLVRLGEKAAGVQVEKPRSPSPPEPDAANDGEFGGAARVFRFAQHS